MGFLNNEGLQFLIDNYIPLMKDIEVIVNTIDDEKQNKISSISLTGDVKGTASFTDNPNEISIITSLVNDGGVQNSSFEIDYEVYSILANLILSSNIAASLGAVKILLAKYDEIIRANSNKLKTYTISYNLTKVSSNLSITSITQHEEFTATLTPDNGYSISSVSVMVNGTDMTSVFYKSGAVNIPYAMGNVVITATAIEAEEIVLPTNGVLLDASHFSIGSGSPTITTDGSGYIVITFNAVGEYFFVSTPGMTSSSTITLYSIEDYICEEATDGLGFYNQYGWCYLRNTQLMNGGSGVYFMLKSGDYSGNVPVTIKLKNVILTVRN